jgi:hypothetical protein
MEVTVAEAPTREQHAAMQAEIASAAQDLLALGQVILPSCHPASCFCSPN